MLAHGASERSCPDYAGSLCCKTWLRRPNDLLPGPRHAPNACPAYRAIVISLPITDRRTFYDHYHRALSLAALGEPDEKRNRPGKADDADGRARTAYAQLHARGKALDQHRGARVRQLRQESRQG